MDRRELLTALARSGATGWLLSALPLQGMEESRSKIQAGDPVDVEQLWDARWSPERAFKYMSQFGEVKACNYVPQTGGSIFHNADEKLIDQELGWARDIVGLNSVRVWVQLSSYELNREDLYKGFEKFLDICASKGLTVLPVLSAEDMMDPNVDPNSPAAHPEPVLDFKPGVHGGGWRYPGRLQWPCCDPEAQVDPKLIATWPQTKSRLKDFTQTFISRYAKEKRIILWDLYNEAPHRVRPLVEYLFRWAREVNPSQPLSVCWEGHDLSDVITFHTYTQPGFTSPNYSPEWDLPGWDFLTELEWARVWKRPMLCTECMARPFGNTLQAILPFFTRYHIGWYVWGLCAGGPAQFYFPWHWPIGSPQPKVWFHCLLYPDGTPYNPEEILLIREFNYKDLPPAVTTQSYWLQGGKPETEPPSNSEI